MPTPAEERNRVIAHRRRVQEHLLTLMEGQKVVSQLRDLAEAFALLEGTYTGGAQVRTGS